MKLKLVLICLLTTFSLNAQEVLRNFALFEYNSYELTASAKSMVDAMLAETGNGKILKVELYGHTDSDGDSEANKTLSQNRVNAVKTYLVSKGISETIFVTEYFGEDKPAFTNSNEDGMQKNRRVEIVFTYETKKEIALEPITPVVSPTPVRTTETSSKRCLPVTGTLQTFRENAKKNIDITGAMGTHLIFQKDCFKDKEGKTITGDVTIEICEVYTKDEMILHNLSTTSYKRMLESAGMVYIKVSKDGEDVNLIAYLPYTIEFPTQTKVQGMQLFYGDTTSGQLNWVSQSSGSKGGDWDYVAQQALDKYVFKSGKLGWINCDHFLQDYDVTNLYVETADTAGVSFCLVFKDFNSVMSRDMTADGISFRNVPIGQTATVVAFRKTQTGAMYASEEIKLEANMRQSIVLAELSEEAFQQKITAFR